MLTILDVPRRGVVCSYMPHEHGWYTHRVKFAHVEKTLVVYARIEISLQLPDRLLVLA